jgi:hypothetical protein
MKIAGVVFIGIGVALLLFAIFNFLQNSNRVVSPIPEEGGVRVILISPSP